MRPANDDRWYRRSSVPVQETYVHARGSDDVATNLGARINAQAHITFSQLESMGSGDQLKFCHFLSTGWGPLHN